jgi:predicted RNase H-like nuclease
MKIAGVDLAWNSEKNPSGVCIGKISDDAVKVAEIYPAMCGIAKILEVLLGASDLCGIAIDAPLIIKNRSGQRLCERNLSKLYGSRWAAAYPTNTTLYPNAKSIELSCKLEQEGFSHLGSEKYQIECYPHPAIIEIFGLEKRLPYKKGKVLERKGGQKRLANFLKALSASKIVRLCFEIDAPYIDDKYIDSLRGEQLENNEDTLDSILCLYIAALYRLGIKSTTFGTVESGYIYVPQQYCM